MSFLHRFEPPSGARGRLRGPWAGVAVLDDGHRWRVGGRRLAVPLRFPGDVWHFGHRMGG